jgi:parallel beta-helix repeat protein
LFVGVGIVLADGMVIKKGYSPIDRGTLYVGGGGSGNYTIIQDAIENASNGDTVFVYDDSSPYYENIVVDKPIQLIGENRQSTVIDGGGSGHTIKITSNNSVIRDFSITKGNNGIYIDSNCEYNNINNNSILENSVGIYFIDECKYNTIDSNIIENNTGDGIHLHYGGGSDDSDFNEFLDNSVSNNFGDGIDIGSSCSDNVLDGNVLNGNSAFGIRLFQSDNYITLNNTVSGEPIYYFYDVHGTAESPVVFEDNVLNVDNAINKAKIYVYDSTYITFRNFSLKNGSNMNLCIDNSEYITVDNCSLENEFYGLVFYSSDNNVISNCTIFDSSYGIYLQSYCDYNTFENNTIFDNSLEGVYLQFRNNNNYFFENDLNGNSVGFYLFDECKNNTFKKNTIENNSGDGIHLHYDGGSNREDNDFNSFLSNFVSYNTGDGIDIGSSCNDNNLDGNILNGNGGYGVRLFQPENYISLSNTVSGESIYYFYNTHGTTSDPIIVEDKVLNVDKSIDKAKVYFYHSSNITIKNFSIKNGTNMNLCIDNSENILVDNCSLQNEYYGLVFYSSDNNIISNCTIFDSSYGIYLQSYCIYNIFENNILSDNSLEAFYLQFRNNYNEFVGNVVANNSVGFYLYDECKYNILDSNIIENNTGNGIHLHYDGGSGRDNNDFNEIYENIIKDNSAIGLYIGSTCDSNRIYSNNFLNNLENANDSGTNTYNEVYPIGGNYWSEYSGVDSDGDGLGDTSFNIPGGSNTDFYPLIFKWGENPPVANFTFNVYNLSVVFDGSESYDRDGLIVVYSFYFGDGNTSSSMIFNHTYGGYGTYSVSLTVIDDDGKSDMISQNVFVKIHVTNLDSKWNFFSLPFNQTVIKTNISVIYNGSEFTWVEAVNQNIIVAQIYEWNRTNQNYDWVDILTPGHGYWMYSYEDCELRAIVESNLTYDDLITDPLFEWNLVGLPYNKKVHKQNISVIYDGTTYTWQEAVDGNIILNFLYLWNENDQNYELSDYLIPGKACWMYAYFDCRLIKSD